MSEPADPIAERMVLAIALAAPSQAAPVFAALTPGVWTDERHLLLASILSDRYAREIPIERRGVMRDCAARAGTDAAAQRIGQFVIDLGAAELPASSIGYYAERIVSLAMARKVRAEAQRFEQKILGAVGLDDDELFRSAVTSMREACDEALVGFKTQAIEPPLSAADLLAGSDEYDWLVPGLLERTDRVIITGFEGHGKALALDTPIPAPKGWTTMGALSVGDEVFAPDGTPTRVIAATDVMRGRPCYRITFSDGATIVADEQHQWLTETVRARECAAKAARRGPLKPRGTDQQHKRQHFPEVVTTRQIAETLHARNGHVLNHSIQTCAPLQYPAQELPVDPYVLGAWLGDGTSTSAHITSADAEILSHIEAAGYSVHQTDGGGKYLWTITRRGAIAEARRKAAELVQSGLTAREAARRTGLSRAAVYAGGGSGAKWTRAVDPTAWVPRIKSLQEQLGELGVLRNKHVPDLYLHSSVPQRLALVQGLMDTDGTVAAGDGSGRGTGASLCEFSVCNERLARDVHGLLLGLGIKVTRKEGPAVLEGRTVGTRYRLQFQTELPTFRLTRKADRLQPLRTRRARLRYITAATPVDSIPVRCIQVARTDGLFVAGRECIPTHNSYLTAQMAAAIAAGIHPFTTDQLPRRFSGYRVLVVDCENSRRQLRRRFRRLLAQVDDVCKANGMAPPDWSTILRFVIRPEGVSLTDPRELARLEQAVAATAPDLLVIGPLYRLSKVDVRDEQAAKELTDVIDLLRVRHNLTVLIETHAGHGQGGSGSRQIRPLGSSLFLRWPEFGYGLRPHESTAHMEHPSLMEVSAWRGARDERHWPKTLRHGQALPWEPADPDYWNPVPVWSAA